MLAPAIAAFIDAPRTGGQPHAPDDAGARHARRVYRVMVARTLAASDETGWRVTVWFAPAEAAGEMRRWLGEQRDLRPQASGDLGSRLAAASHAVETGRTWLAIPPDGVALGLSSRALREADAALAYGGVVLGPMRTGGVYLLGAQAPLPDLWTAVPWGTPRLLDGLRRRLAEREIGWRELAPLDLAPPGATQAGGRLI